MTSTTSQQKNDCVIVAISNATGLSYSDVQAKLGPCSPKHGYFGHQYIPVIESLGFVRQKSIPRRGQDKITGLVRMISNKNASGHMVYMKRGIVFDAFLPNGLPIKEYQNRTSKCHIQMIWVKIDKTQSDAPLVDTPVSLDFLRSLKD